MVEVTKKTLQTEFFETPIDGINEIPLTKDFNEKFRNIEEMVAHLMEKYPHTRKDYNLLFLMLMKEMKVAEIYIDVKKYMRMPKTSSINRARRKIFEEARQGDISSGFSVFLESDEEIENQKVNEKEYRKYFRK